MAAKKLKKRKTEYICVLALDGTPLMPTKRKRKIFKLIAEGKARIVENVPLVVQLLYEHGEEIQPVAIGPDCGRTNIGLAAVNKNGEALMLIQCITRNEEIKKLMDKRRACRRASRMGERKARQRRAKRFNTMFAAGCKMRKLPQCVELIACHYITNTEARFCNRKRTPNWLTPTATQLLRTHLNLINKIRKWMPISDIGIEVNKFDFAKMEDPTVFGEKYQNGILKDYLDVDDYIYQQQEGKCLLCGESGIDHYHHIVPRHENGSEHHSNKAGLCDRCHDLVHKDLDTKHKLIDVKKGMKAKYRGASVLNQIMPFFIKEMIDMFGEEHVHLTDGRETAKARAALGIIKTDDNPCHVVDAYLVAASG